MASSSFEDALESETTFAGACGKAGASVVPTLQIWQWYDDPGGFLPKKTIPFEILQKNEEAAVYRAMDDDDDGSVGTSGAPSKMRTAWGIDTDPALVGWNSRGAHAWKCQRPWCGVTWSSSTWSCLRCHQVDAKRPQGFFARIKLATLAPDPGASAPSKQMQALYGEDYPLYANKRGPVFTYNHVGKTVLMDLDTKTITIDHGYRNMEESYHVAPNWASGVKKAVVEAGVSGPNTIGGVLRDATSTWVDIERDDGTLIRLQPAPYLNAKDGNYKIEYEKNGDALWMMGLPLPTAISAEAAEHVKQVNANIKTVDDAEWPGRVQYDVVPNAAAASQDSDDDYDVIDDLDYDDDDAATAAAALGEAVAAQGSPFAEDDSDDYSVVDDMDYESDEEGAASAASAATAAAALGEAVAAQGSPFAEDDSDEESDEESDDENDEEYEDEDGGEDFEVPLSDVAQRFPDPMEGMSPAQRNTAAALRDEHHLHPKVIFPTDWFDRPAFEQKRMINMHQNKQTLLTQGILSHKEFRTMLYLDPVDPRIPPETRKRKRASTELVPMDSTPEPLPLTPAFVKLTGRERTREERREERTRVAEAKKEAAEQARLAKALKRAEERSSARGSGRGVRGRGRGRGMSREDRADARRQRLAEEAMADGAPVTKEPRRRNGPLTPAQTGYAELAKLSSYPWNAQPMTRRVMLNMDDMPSNLVNALRDRIDFERKEGVERWFNEPKYRYVAPDSKGAQGSNPNTFPGFQVQWYSNKTKRTKRLGNVQHTEIGALMRVAASIDLRLLFDEDVRLNFYESTVRWVQWIAAQDVEDAAARKEESFRRAAQWLSEVDASLQSLRVYRPSQTKRVSVSSAVDNSFAEILDNDDDEDAFALQRLPGAGPEWLRNTFDSESFLLNADDLDPRAGSTPSLPNDDALDGLLDSLEQRRPVVDNDVDSILDALNSLDDEEVLGLADDNDDENLVAALDSPDATKGREYSVFDYLV